MRTASTEQREAAAEALDAFKAATKDRRRARIWAEAGYASQEASDDRWDTPL